MAIYRGPGRSSGEVPNERKYWNHIYRKHRAKQVGTLPTLFTGYFMYILTRGIGFYIAYIVLRDFLKDSDYWFVNYIKSLF